MLFGLVSGIGQGIGVLDGAVIVEGEGTVLRVNFGRPIVTNQEFVAQLDESDELFPNYFGEDLLYFRKNAFLTFFYSLNDEF